MSEKTYLKRVLQPVIPTLVKMIRDGNTKDQVFLCRKGNNHFTSLLFFSTMQKMKEHEVPNVPEVGMLYVVLNNLKVGVDELDEINLLQVK